MKSLQQHLTKYAFENEDSPLFTDEDLVTSIRDTKKAVREWIVENPQLEELKKQGTNARISLSEFYTRLPTIKDAGVVVAELQTHIDDLLDHIIDTHNFIDSLIDELGVIGSQKSGGKNSEEIN